MKAMFNNPFKKEGNWYKGNLHTHTTNSDGLLSPPEMIGQYRKKNYDFVCITDHNRRTDVACYSDEKFLAICGEEIGAYRDGKEKDRYDFDIVAVNTRMPLAGKCRNMPAQKVIEMIRHDGGEAIIAHPYFMVGCSAAQDIMALEDFIGMEVYNTSVEMCSGRGYSGVYWDELLCAGRRVWGIAADDAHWHFNEFRPNDTAVSSVMVKTEKLTVENIMDSLRQGYFYSTNGPLIGDLAITGDTIRIKTDPVRIINFMGGRSFRKLTASADKLLTEAECKLTGKDNFVRIECADDKGHTAWTNPVFLN
jgi:hypothetical protein